MHFDCKKFCAKSFGAFGSWISKAELREYLAEASHTAPLAPHSFHVQSLAAGVSAAVAAFHICTGLRIGHFLEHQSFYSCPVFLEKHPAFAAWYFCRELVAGSSFLKVVVVHIFLIFLRGPPCVDMEGRGKFFFLDIFALPPSLSLPYLVPSPHAPFSSPRLHCHFRIFPPFLTAQQLERLVWGGGKICIARGGKGLFSFVSSL